MSGEAKVSNALSSITDDKKEREKNIKKWNRRLRLFFCFLNRTKSKDSLYDVAHIFADYFANLNLSFTDVAAGFLLLSKYQAAQRDWILQNGITSSASKLTKINRFCSNVPIRDSTQFLDISNPIDSHFINDLIYYMNYSLAIYGWPFAMLDDSCLLCCIYPHLKLSLCCSRPKTKKPAKVDKNGVENMQSEDHFRATSLSADNHTSMPIVLYDNCCSCNAASVERRLEQHNYDIIYVSYKSNVGVVPFLVAADHAKRTIIVAIRGSMCLADLVTDMNGTVDKMPIENCPNDWLCHRGITSAAMYVRKTLIDERILERAFACRPDLDSHEYELILCGHSLGAGAAAILGVVLRKQHPTLKAFLYSPPGGLLSLPVVEYTKQFAVSVILGNDTVPRLGVAQLERLRYHTLLSLESTRRSSRRVLARALFPPKCFGSNEVRYDPEHSLDLLHSNDGITIDYHGFKVPFQSQPQMLYVPGKLIHIVKNYAFRQNATRRLSTVNTGPLYQAVYTENIAYDRILLSEGMLSDHLPQNLMQAIKMLFSNTLPGRRDSKWSTISALSVSDLMQTSQKNDEK